MAESLNQKIGKRLRDMRKQAGYTAVQMAKLFGCSIDHYRRIEYGKHTLTAEKFVILRDYLGIDPLYLLTGEIRNPDDEDPETPATLPPPVSEPHELQVMRELFDYCHAMILAV